MKNQIAFSSKGLDHVSKSSGIDGFDLHGNPFVFNRPECLKKESKPLKRFPNLLLCCITGLKPGVNETRSF